MGSEGVTGWLEVWVVAGCVGAWVVVWGVRSLVGPDREIPDLWRARCVPLRLTHESQPMH